MAQGQEAKKGVEGKTGKIELSKHPGLSGEAPTVQTGGKDQLYEFSHLQPLRPGLTPGVAPQLMAPSSMEKP